ncbi:hypothetical protein CPAR01_01687 [Colletotrichum paranaense]|uniref:Uncharacterized protein n=2 Tax=Colletotrichum acutatum species complex TaxID=2707335 RepID=A0AAI9YYG0_9PEZI|nr:uncharacterized protein CCOS01_06384 [Colletotrichum costaricense]XP_060356833.1 uncharacterized protein CPAR01_01687 [Colletotrichum paranaense]KAK1528550.1 hypothetical protein CCOS01_06384 [Colletotrichum costaricense]KAK1547720.1 hypothetical protein CPAR01_01687 [Colletotrichum paranaense]
MTTWASVDTSPRGSTANDEQASRGYVILCTFSNFRRRKKVSPELEVIISLTHGTTRQNAQTQIERYFNIATQAGENKSHPTPSYTKPDQMDQEGNRQPAQQQPPKAKPPHKTETEEKIENETPRLSTGASASMSESSSQQDGVQYVTRRSRSKRHDPAKQHRQVAQQQVGPQNQQNQQLQTKSSSGAPSVKLDMNLDVDIDLKAKVQGDITLSVL